MRRDSLRILRVPPRDTYPPPNFRMHAKNIVFLDRATLVAELPPLTLSHTWTEYDGTDPADVVARCRDAHIVITNKVPLSVQTVAQLPYLELVAVAAAGTDNIDRRACAERGISVINCPDYSALSVPEHAIALAMALRRNLVGYWRDMPGGAWSRSNAFFAELHPVADLHGATLGIVGGGPLGRRTGRLGEAFGMHVLFAERREAATVRPGYTPFDEVLRQADVLSLHCPLQPDTCGLIGERELRAMKPGALLINTARGPIVDEQALLRALDEGWIGGAGLDVLAVEPPLADHQLLVRPRHNLIVTPHIAWRTPLAMQRLARQLVEGIQRQYEAHDGDGGAGH